jgi:hypothetical protein
MPTNSVLSSEWSGLSKHLLATFYEVRKNDSGRWVQDSQCDPQAVQAPLTEASMEIVLNWQSPFEQAGAESKAPALMSMLQSGALQPLVTMLGGQNDSEKAASAQQNSNKFLSQFEGRTGITKLNSTQVFTGMPPAKIQVTALFRAWKNPLAEVETPFEKLMAWALPVKLSPDGTFLERGVKAAKGGLQAIDVLMPSKSPIRIAMQYKGRTFSPLVIESIGMPLSSPVDVSGRFVELAVPMTLCTLTALDRDDWTGARTVQL